MYYIYINNVMLINNNLFSKTQVKLLDIPMQLPQSWIQCWLLQIDK